MRAALAELADAEYQERVWRGLGTDEVGSLNEALCELYDDSGLGAALESSIRPVFDSTIDSALSTLLELARPLVDGDADPGKILVDPRLPSVRQAAADILFAIARSDKW